MSRLRSDPGSNALNFDDESASLAHGPPLTQARNCTLRTPRASASPRCTTMSSRGNNRPIFSNAFSSPYNRPSASETIHHARNADSRFTANSGGELFEIDHRTVFVFSNTWLFRCNARHHPGRSFLTLRARRLAQGSSGGWLARSPPIWMGLDRSQTSIKIFPHPFLGEKCLVVIRSRRRHLPAAAGSPDVEGQVSRRYRANTLALPVSSHRILKRPLGKVC